jgi:hypothetical protein
MPITPKKISDFTPVISPTGNEMIPYEFGGGNGYITPNQIKGLFAGHYYTEVNTYADLPAANLHATEIYIVLTSTGVWLINRKDAGLWYSNGSSWTRLGDVPSYFSSANFQIYDGGDNTKVAMFNTASIAHATTRTYTLPDADGTLALTSHNHTGTYEVPLTFGSGLTRTVNAIANDLITGKTGGQTIIGGTAVGDYLTYKSTTGAGTATGIAHQWTGGTNGGTVIATMLNNGNFGIGITDPSERFVVYNSAGSCYSFVKSVTYAGHYLWAESDNGTTGEAILNLGHSGISNPTRAFYIGLGSAGKLIFGTKVNGWGGIGDGDLMALTNTGCLMIGGVSPTARLNLPAGTATAGTSPLKLTSGVLTTAAEAGALEFVTDDLSFTITTGAARKHFIFDDGTVNTSGRLAQYTTNGRLTNAGDISGSGNRLVQASAAGAISATASIVTGKLADSATITLLTTDGNWTLGLYTGAAISGTYEGMYYKDDNYFYTAYSDNDWLRIPRA